MIAKILIYSTQILLISFLVSNKVQACDACGCSLGGFNIGIIPQTENHFAGMKFSRSRFFAEMNHANQSPEYSHDNYYRWDFMGRFALSERLQLNLILPYLYNDMNGSHEATRLNGLGDPLALINYKLISQKATADDQWVHNLWMGTGLKAPLGKFEYSQTSQLVNPNFQLGTGSWDYLFTGNYMVSRNRIGMNMESIYKINSINSQEYRFGNQFNAQANLFYNISTEKIQVIPYTGGYLERGAIHTFEGFQEVNSGGIAVFANAGLQVQGKSLLLNLTYQHPMSQNYNSDKHVTIKAHERFSFTLLAFINKGSAKDVFQMK